MELEPTTALPRATLMDGVYDRIRQGILTGDLPAGTELNQVELARKYAVSRVPVREALRRLQAERLLIANPFQRFIVATLSPEKVLELHDIRVELEVFGLKRMLRLPKKDFEARIARAREVAAGMNASLSGAEWTRADRNFHKVLYGDDSAVAPLIEELRDRLQRYLYVPEIKPERVDSVRVEHERLLDALCARVDTKVETALRYHADHTRDALAKILEQTTARRSK